MNKSGVLWAGLICAALFIWRYEDTSKRISKPPTTKPAPTQPAKPKPPPKRPEPPCPN